MSRVSMRRIFVWCMLLGAMLASCDRKRVVSEVDYSVEDVSDSVDEASSDSLLLFSEPESEEEDLPANADELFDDFVFEFSRLRKFQASRVEFPLPLVEHGDTVWLAKEDWKHENLFAHYDYYTVFFNNEEQMELEKSTDLEHVDVEWIDMGKHKFKTFHFERRKGEWMLVEESLQPLEESPLADFMDFYARFVTDADFQQRSVADPLRYVTADPDDDFSMIEGTLDHEQWDAFKPQLPSGRLTNIRYGQTYDAPRRMILVKQGISNGLMDILTFRKRGKDWKLVSYEN